MIEVRRYGSVGPPVIVLHGGPGAPGYMAPVARALADEMVVLEPLQRASGGEPLTVARHVADLDEVVRSLGGDVRPALVGSSWGGMLALAYAAAHPDATRAIVVVGSGTFDPVARARMHELIAERRSQRRDAYIFAAADDEGDDDELPFDRAANQQTWDDMLRLQAAGVYPAAFAAIRVPVVMLHGTYDPHPGEMIRDALLPFIPHLEYVQWDHCGHYPWRERHARAAFFSTVHAFLARHSSPPSP